MTPRTLYFIIVGIGVAGILLGGFSGQGDLMLLGLACAFAGLLGLLLVQP